MVGTSVHLLTKPYYVGDIVHQGCSMLHRVFWSFPLCIEAFKWCKPFISIDGTHLYGKYGGTLLMAIAQDGNSNILPIAFAVVKGETKKAWSFFSTNLRQHVTPQEGILIISDRHVSIISAIEAEGSGWHPPMAYHVYCIRHIASNFAREFKNKDAKRVLINAAYSKTYSDFVYYYGLLRDEKEEMTEWVDQISREKWAQYADEGRRFGHMTTNLSECINAVMKGTRNLPITAIVKSTYFRLAKLFVQKGGQAQAQIAGGQKWSQYVLRAVDDHKQYLEKLTVSPFTRDLMYCLVTERGEHVTQDYRVHLGEGRCDCGAFQALHYPCRHAIAVCNAARVDWGSFTHPVYSMEWVYRVYRMEFTPIADEHLWPPYNGLPIHPDPALRRSNEGRPVSTRIRNEMDEVESSQPKRCGLCRNEGHTRRKCPTLLASSSSHHD